MDLRLVAEVKQNNMPKTEDDSNGEAFKSNGMDMAAPKPDASRCGSGGKSQARRSANDLKK